ncbi:MAG: universal stress protein [Bacteroidota bacterium]|nr:universal stress protein [Bacteroidota bacterium]
MKNLERKLTLTAIIAISIAGMLSGIFVLPGIAAAKTGSSVWLAFLIAAICILPAVLSKSELATSMPKSGGAYVYIERAFGPIFGTISGLGLWISLLLKSSFSLIGFGAYLLVLINIDIIYIKYIAIGCLLLIMFLNILGVKKVGRIQIIIVSLSLLGLISLLFLGLPAVEEQMLTPFISHGNSGLISTIAFVYISYAGVTKIAAIAGEVKNPNRNIPLGMLISLFLITAIYVLITYTLVGNISSNDLATDIKPIYTLANLLGGQWFGFIIAGIGVITLISMANSGVLASSRFPFAMSRDKLLPTYLSKVHKKYLTPVNTILITCLVMALVILFLDVEKIAKLASAFKVMMFIAVNLCVIIFRETAVQWYKPTYKSPFYPFIQIFGIVSGFILLFYLGWMPIVAIIVISILGIIIYYLFGSKTSRLGVLKNYGSRPAMFLFFKQKNQEELNNAENIETDLQQEWLDGQINSDAGVIIPLFGNEYSPESLVEIGASLNRKKTIQVVNITEVPDQTSLDAIIEDSPKIKSIARKLTVVSDINNLDIDFESIATHHLSDTIQTLSQHSNSDWLVISWSGREYNGILINNPLGWIVSNINSNFALFKDNGVRYIKKILLAIRPNSKDMEELIATTAHISKYHNASFTLLHAVNNETSNSNLAKTSISSKKLLENYTDISELRIEKSENPKELVSEISSEYDLLILGTPRRDTWISVLFGTGRDEIASSSTCSVLRLTIKS